MDNDKLRAALQTLIINWGGPCTCAGRGCFVCSSYVHCARDVEALLASEKPPGQVNQAIGAETNLKRIQPSIAGTAPGGPVEPFLTLSEGIEQGRQEGYAQGYACASADRVRESYDIEAISAKVHRAWIEAKLSQGITSRLSADGEELIVPYEKLSAGAKDLDRLAVRTVVDAILAAPPAKEPAK